LIILTKSGTHYLARKCPDDGLRVVLDLRWVDLSLPCQTFKFIECSK